MRNIIKIAVVNFTTSWGDKERNLAQIVDYAHAAGKEGVDLLLLPETALTGYDDESDQAPDRKMHTRLAETIPGPSTRVVAEIAKQYGMHIVFGMVEREAEDPLRCYNVAAIISPSGECSSYRKMHLPYFLRETAWAERGTEPCLIDTEWGPIGVAICWETYLYPEMIRYYKASGARVVLNLTATPGTPAPAKSVELSLPAHTFIYSIFIASADLCGPNRAGDLFLGASNIMGPSATGHDSEVYAGHAAGDPNTGREGMHIATINLDLADRVNTPIQATQYCAEIDSPFWRPELYAGWYGQFAK